MVDAVEAAAVVEDVVEVAAAEVVASDVQSR